MDYNEKSIHHAKVTSFAELGARKLGVTQTRRRDRQSDYCGAGNASSWINHAVYGRLRDPSGKRDRRSDNKLRGGRRLSW